MLPRRYVVGRTFASLAQRRRLSKDYEYLTESSAAAIYVPVIETMPCRFA